MGQMLLWWKSTKRVSTCFYRYAKWIDNKLVNGYILDECNDDILSAHESELDRIRGFYADNNEIFKLIEKRESLWEQKKEMDVSIV